MSTETSLRRAIEQAASLLESALHTPPESPLYRRRVLDALAVLEAVKR